MNSNLTPEVASALALIGSGKAAQAEIELTAYCRSKPEDPAGWYLLGAALHAQRRTAAALTRMERSLELSPAQPEVLKATAVLMYELRRNRAGLERAERACKLAPGDPNAWLIAGSLLEAQGQGEEALSRYDKALTLIPDWQPALLNRGALLMGLSRYRQALENYHRLVAAHPGQADALFSLAEAQLACGDFMEAEVSCRQAIRLNPALVGAHIDLALALSMMGAYGTARDEFSAALALDREKANLHIQRAIRAGGGGLTGIARLLPEEIFLWQHGELQKSCDWRYRVGLEQALSACADALKAGSLSELSAPAAYFHSLSFPLSEQQQRALAQGVAAGVAYRAGDGIPVPKPKRYRSLGGPLRIGYISPDYRQHPVAYLHWRQMALHDRGRFRVFAYSLHPDDGSEIRERVKSSCDEWRSCENDTIHLTASRIRYDGIQVLVDLSGYTRFTRPEILTLRPAPIQVAYMGMPATSGSTFIDYRITDEISTPRTHAAFWSERLVYLPGTLFIYNDTQEVAASPSRVDVGLPEEAFVFCCFNNAFKIEPDVFGVWMRLLSRVPGSVLWLLSDDENVRSNLKREAAARGVAPERLIFAAFQPLAEHLSRYALADLFLDTFYCGAHTTAADALWSGLPVLTCLGGTMAARLASSIVRAAGLPEMVVASHEEFEARAYQLASRQGELAAIRSRLQAAKGASALFDTAGRVGELERAYEMMWERYAAGLPPESFAVPRGGEPAHG